MIAPDKKSRKWSLINKFLIALLSAKRNALAGKRREGMLGEKMSSEKEKATEKIAHTELLKTERELETISLCFNTYGILLDHMCLSKTFCARKQSSKDGERKKDFRPINLDLLFYLFRLLVIRS